ncbi:accessory protein p10 [Capuchin kidney parvovirus]|uniref:Accessory protein p10 n=1 Tax=Capuchin kidney parvovirus TaxID=2695302 RepID=A0A6B9L267_9VIRU|nr:accessory protein p10 [Capuchin kidney parvovirus]QHB35436.1 accessory protein p10 [Capuchin kidney parvovirus]
MCCCWLCGCERLDTEQIILIYLIQCQVEEINTGSGMRCVPDFELRVNGTRIRPLCRACLKILAQFRKTFQILSLLLTKRQPEQNQNVHV